MNARKLSVSLPADRLAELERVRKRLHLGRSEAVQQAIDLWLSARNRDGRIASYLAGYVASPEDAGDANAYVSAWATGLSGEDW